MKQVTWYVFCLLQIGRFIYFDIWLELTNEVKEGTSLSEADWQVFNCRLGSLWMHRDSKQEFDLINCIGYHKSVCTYVRWVGQIGATRAS